MSSTSSAPLPVSDPLREAVLVWVREHPGRPTHVVAENIGKRKADVIAALTQLETSGMLTGTKKGAGKTWEAR
jgi:hypothetical protein